MDRRFTVTLTPEGVVIREDPDGECDGMTVAFYKAKRMAGWSTACLDIYRNPGAPLWAGTR